MNLVTDLGDGYSVALAHDRKGPKLIALVRPDGTPLPCTFYLATEEAMQTVRESTVLRLMLVRVAEEDQLQRARWEGEA